MQIVDDVRQRKLEDYQSTTQAEVDRLSVLPEVVAVYSTGMVKAPGISDLDLIAVVDLEKTSGRVRRVLKRALKIPAEDYIRTHPIFAISPDLFTQIRWLGDLSTLECLHGAELQAEQVPESFQSPLRAVTLLETGIHKFFALRYILLRTSPSARDLLLTLNSIGYSLSLGGQLKNCGSSLKISIEEFRARLLELRSDWFILESQQRIGTLVRLIEQAPELLLQALEVGSASLVRECQLSLEQAEGQGSLAVDPHGLVALSLQRPNGDLSQSFGDWYARYKKELKAEWSGPIGMAISFSFYHDCLQSDLGRQRYLDSQTDFDHKLHHWCLQASAPLSEGLKRRANVMCQYARWYRPLWSCSISFSPYTPWLMGRRSRWNKLWARIESRTLRY